MMVATLEQTSYESIREFPAMPRFQTIFELRGVAVEWFEIRG